MRPAELLLERGGSSLFRLEESPPIFRWALRGRLERGLVDAFSVRCREEAGARPFGLVVELDGLEGADPALRALMTDPAFRAERHPRVIALVSRKVAARLMIRSLSAPTRLLPGAPRVEAASTAEEALDQVRAALAG